MLEQVMTLPIDKWAQDKAEEYFVRICGEVPEDGESFYSRMRVGTNLKSKALYCEFPYSEIAPEADRVYPEGNEFKGGIFQYFNRPSSQKLLVYLLTIGPLPAKDPDGMLEAFYVDAWGSAYVEAAHDVFKKRLQRIYGSDLFVSEPFGPGYYGIHIEQTREIFQILNGSTIGMTLTDGGMMLPEKSCSGFYVISNEDVALPKDSCESCLSGHNCRFCKKYL